MNTTTFNYFIDTATTRKQPKTGQVRLSMRQIIEEPCEVKVSSTVLETSEVGDSLTEFNKVMRQWLSQLALVSTFYGWETAQIRTQLGLEKQKHQKGDAIPATHAVDGVAIAASQFVRYDAFQSSREHGHHWTGEVNITVAPFVVIRRPPVSRRQLHLMVPSKGGERRKYGGTVTRHGVRKGDLVKAEMAGRVSIGWVSGDTARQISASDFDWKRLGQFTASKVQLIRRATGLLVNCPQRASVRTASSRPS